jgi:hypothetical protein
MIGNCKENTLAKFQHFSITFFLRQSGKISERKDGDAVAIEIATIEPLLVDRTEACRVLSVSLSTFKRMIAAGLVKPLTLPRGGRRYSVAQLREMIAAETASGTNQ